jgi:hypothetical protein
MESAVRIVTREVKLVGLDKNISRQNELRKTQTGDSLSNKQHPY